MLTMYMRFIWHGSAAIWIKLHLNGAPEPLTKRRFFDTA